MLLGLLTYTLTAFSAPTTSYTLHFTAYGLRPGNFKNIYYIDANGEPELVKFKSKQRTEEYKATILNDDPHIKFLLKSNADPTKEANYSELATVNIPTGSEKLLFVFMPNKTYENRKAFRVLPVKDVTDAGGTGTVRVVNLTNITLIGLADGKQFELASMDISEPVHAAKGTPANFSIAAEGSSRYHLVYRNEFRIDSENRAILFLTPPYRKASFKLGGQMLYEDTGAMSP